MSKDILIETGDLSSGLLKKTLSKLDSASSKLVAINNSPVYYSPTGYTSLYPSNVLADVTRLKRSIGAIQEKLRLYANILDVGPDAICDVDARCKNDLTNWRERTEYKFSISTFGIATATIGDLVVDVWQDAVAGADEVVDIIAEKADYGANVIVSKATQIVSDIKSSYENHGALYDWVEYGKCTIKAVSAIVKVVTGAVEIATGGGIPLGIMNIISGINTLNNVAADATYIYCDAYELVGTTNWLKDTLTENGEKIGAYLGNPEAGELFGELTYVGFEMVTFLDSADGLLKDYGKVNTLVTESTGYSFCWGWTSFDDILEESTGKIVWDAIKGTKDILKDAWDFGKTISAVN